jgi:hypothetical protein
MNAHRKINILALGALVAVVAAAACSNAKGNGQLAVQLVDAPNPGVEQIWVNVTAVRAHVAGTGWRTVSEEPLRVDLLTLRDQVAPLGLLDLPAGTVTQLRLLVESAGNTVVVSGVEKPLVVPSGTESGIKINGPWEIGPCTQTTVTLDFDGLKSLSVHPTGAGEEWILRPVIRTRKVERTPGTCGGDEGTGEVAPPAAPLPAAPGGAGAACTQPTDCLSGVCNDGACAPGGAGVPCQAAADCVAGVCDADGTCAAGNARGAWEGCTVSTDCLSSTCDERICAPGGQGQGCRIDADCAEGFGCLTGACFERNAP